MFVCHGNICRSPMAEFIFKRMLTDSGMLCDFEVSSSATSDEEIFYGVGNPVYQPAKAELLRHGIDPRGKRAVKLRKSDYDKYDMFICMDDQNVRGANTIFGKDPNKKILKLMDIDGRGGDVSDPWYTDRFDIAYKDIFDGCAALYKKLVGKSIKNTF